MSRLENAAERVAKFLQARAQLTGGDPDVVYKVNHEELLTDDLLALVEAAHFMRVMLGIEASARIEYSNTTEEQGLSEIRRVMPLAAAEKQVKRWNEVSEDRAFVVQRLVTDWEPKQ
ncbi:hypothetical protein BARRETLEMON_62 [Arthrobacter phage BarretLemon]|uniref:Uncharacterized protein n=3 Tax=Marthavirus barretlemon TaxID=2560300 RepID=A0A386KN96_9CAUD|nr:DNA binding protein [Arthrobacter phage BarretLemon]AMM44524.1 hypothetical protein BARRETLEMON_62 [Arthrobacter phage BarretLemon]ASR78092.1 hypothetical protein SEA_TIMINATOR_63 [Arthrobacter phage Timinator]AYD86534.1 hypothetical protein SEA_LEEROYJ_63 [Arthrobacter phage LeeroyJ]